MTECPGANIISFVEELQDRQGLICWLIDNYDERKASLSSRLAILLSADAVLLAATTFLIDSITLKIENGSRFDSLLQIAGGVSVFIAIAFQIISIVVATSGMTNVWKTHRSRLADEPVSRLIFYPR